MGINSLGGGGGSVPSDNITAGSFGKTVSLSPGFGAFTTVDPDNPSLVVIDVVARTDGSSPGIVRADVDEDASGSATYTTTPAFAQPGLGANVPSGGVATLPLQPNAQFRITNVQDPTGANQILTVRAQIITP